MPALHFYWKVLCSDHACCLTLSAKQDGLREVAFSVPPWVGIAGKYVLAAAWGYRAGWVHFGIARFFLAIPTEYEGTVGVRLYEKECRLALAFLLIGSADSL